VNIVIPTADYPPIEGGIASVALHVSRELAALGHTVTVIAPHFPGMAAFDKAEPVRVVRYRGYGLGPLRFFPLAVVARRFLGAADLVLAINVAYGGVLGWLSGRRFVVFAYAYEFLKFSRRSAAAALLRRVYAAAAGIVAISNYTRDRLQDFGVSGQRVSVVYPGAARPEPCSIGELNTVRRDLGLDGKRAILCVGRFIRRKGHLTLVRALPRIIERIPNVALVLVGRGPMKGEIRGLVQSLGLTNHVVMPGYLPDKDIAALYQLCDVFALPNGQDADGQVEGFGLVFAEAHACGKPVVAGRSGGAAEAVLDGETGILVEPDQPVELADAILSLLSDPSRAGALGEAGRRRVEAELNWKSFTRGVLASAEPRP